MRINNLKIKNFRPFYSDHELDLTNSGQNDLVVVFAENMRGKTAILNAIRWALYGKALNRLGDIVPIFADDNTDHLLNNYAIRNDIYEMQVLVDFSHRGNEYNLVRRAYSNEKPSLDNDTFTIKKYMHKDGNAVGIDEIDRIISGILHEDVSRFSLFDGEMLAEYEKLLTDNERKYKTVKDAIEKILGLPALTNSTIYLDDIKDEFVGDYNRQLKREKRNEDNIEKLEGIKDELQSRQRELERMKVKLSEYMQTKSEAESDLRQHEEVSKTFERISEIESEITSADRSIEESKSEIKNILHDSWWLPLSSKLLSVKTEFQHKLEKQAEAKNYEILARHINSSINQKTCTICGTHIAKGAADRLKKKLKHYEDVNKEKLDISDETRLHEKLSFLNDLETQRIDERIRNLSKNIMEKDTLRSEKLSYINRIKYELGDFNKSDHESKLSAYKSASDTIIEIERRIDDSKRKIDELMQERENIQRKLDRATGADRETKDRATLARIVHNTFLEAIDLFRDKARTVVSDEANKIFKELTTEKSYNGLEINDNYGLSIIDSQGYEVSGRSAGAEQIVALSLIGGLNKASASGESPVVMDTNFGRLDKPHRENVLKWISSLEQQVILLVHSGELEKEELSEYDIKYSKSYHINKIDEWRSEIVQSEY